MTRIEVLGSGSPNCRRLEANGRAAVAELGLEAEANIEKVTDMAEIVRRGVIQTPGLAVDGTIVSVGRIPSPTEIEGWLR